MSDSVFVAGEVAREDCDCDHKRESFCLLHRRPKLSSDVNLDTGLVERI